MRVDRNYLNQILGFALVRVDMRVHLALQIEFWYQNIAYHKLFIGVIREWLRFCVFSNRNES